MAAHDTISDPTDWLGLPVASLEPLEAGLRCEICKDFYTAPVITACCHTFCSGCIRRSLSAVNASRKCPLCWAPFDEGQLRKNKVVEELVKTFQAAREDILALGRAAKDAAEHPAQRGTKRKLSEVQESENRSSGPSPRKTRSQTQHKQRSISDSVEPEEEGEDDVEQQEIPEDIPVDDGKVSCPICQQRMPEAQVFTHLDTHSNDKPVTSNGPAPGLATRIQPVVQPVQPLPTLSYSLLNENQLRKKLRELGIPPDGNKQTMSRRHTEWRNLVNANCDSSLPKSKSQLLQDLMSWERTQKASSNPYTVKAAKSSVMEKDFDRSGWSNSHNTEFGDLIAAARAKRNAAQKINEPTKIGEENPLSITTESHKMTDGAFSSEDMPPSSQTDVVNLISPAKTTSVNGVGGS